jgi:cytochrome c-type biogenesis protein CcmH/NrfG
MRPKDHLHRSRKPSRRPHRRGFFLIYGWRTLTRREFGPPVQMRCPRCRRDAAVIGKVRRQWFTFMVFVPVFPLSQRTRFTQCTACGSEFDTDLDTMRRRGAVPDAGDWQYTIRLFNEMRETPEDGQRLAALLDAYVNMGECGEAIAAARHFPKALESNAEAMTALAAAHDGAGSDTDADRWLTAALERDSTCAPALALLAKRSTNAARA